LTCGGAAADADSVHQRREPARVCGRKLRDRNRQLALDNQRGPSDDADPRRRPSERSQRRLRAGDHEGSRALAEQELFASRAEPREVDRRADAAREARDAEIDKKTAQLDRQLKSLEDKLTREERELSKEEDELSHRKMEEAGTHIENITGLFGGRRKASRLSSSLTKRRMTQQAKSDVEESVDAIKDFQRQIAELQKRREEVIAEINDRWGRVVNEITEVTIAPKKTDVLVKVFGVAWMPHYVVRSGTETFELPAFGAE